MNPKYLLLVGGAGNLGTLIPDPPVLIPFSLGRAVIKNFKDSWKTLSIDLRVNSESHFNILLNDPADLAKALPGMYSQISKVSEKFDSIMCVAGGWAGGSIKSPEIFAQMDKMSKMNLQTALLAAHLASKFLNTNGLLLLTGAAVPFKEPSPGMLAYALSKTATHSLALNMAELEDLPKDATVATILPEVLDTPENRKAMPEADFSKWASIEGVAGLLRMWAEGSNRPKNGSFAVLKSVNGTVVPEFI